MDLMVVVVEDVKGGEEEMEMEVVEVEDVKDPLEELEELVVLALMDQTPTVSGKTCPVMGSKSINLLISLTNPSFCFFVKY